MQLSPQPATMMIPMGGNQRLQGAPSLLMGMSSPLHTGGPSSPAAASGSRTLPDVLVQQLVSMANPAAADDGYATPPATRHEDVFHAPESGHGEAAPAIRIATGHMEE
eukprot:1650734-Pyramimonas_sp.AAC.1